MFSWRRGAVEWLTGYRPGFATNWAARWLPADLAVEPQLGVRFEFDRQRAASKTGLKVVPLDKAIDSSRTA